MKSQNHICGKCGREKRKEVGYEYCYECNLETQRRISMAEKEMIRNHPAKGDGFLEHARRWNAEHPMVLGVTEAAENYRIYTGRMTA